MLVRQERIAIALLLGVSVVTIVAHVILGMMGSSTFAKPFTPDSLDGEFVVTEGTINDFAVTKSGGHVTFQLNNVTIFVPAQIAQKIAIRNGDSVTVYGLVQTYRGKKEIVPASSDDIRVMN